MKTYVLYSSNLKISINSSELGVISRALIKSKVDLDKNCYLATPSLALKGFLLHPFGFSEIHDLESVSKNPSISF